MRAYGMAVTCLALAACATGQVPASRLPAEEAVEAAEERSAGSDGDLEAARAALEAGDAALADGRSGEADHLFLLARLRARTALVRAETGDLERERQAVLARAKEALAHAARIDRERQELEEEVYLWRQQQAEIEHYRKLAGSYRAVAERFQQRASQAEEEKNARQALAQAREAFLKSERFEAERYAPSEHSLAATQLRQAEQDLAARDYPSVLERARTITAAALEAARKAEGPFKEARLKEERARRIQERNASLLKAAKAIPGIEAYASERGVHLVLAGDTVFPSGARAFVDDARPLLDQVAKLAKRFPDFPIRIEGYTDNRGRLSFNLALSETRARSVLGYLEGDGGVPASRMTSFGFGPESPRANNDTRTGREKNRRVEVILLYPEGGG